MRTIETIATISPAGDIHLDCPDNLPVGRFQVVLVIDEAPLLGETAPPINTLEANETHRPFQGKSFMDVAAEWVGCSSENPADLSTNPQYLKSYGQ